MRFTLRPGEASAPVRVKCAGRVDSSGCLQRGRHLSSIPAPVPQPRLARFSWVVLKRLSASGYGGFLPCLLKRPDYGAITGFSMETMPTSQIDSRLVRAKSKNPARCSVVLALGESNSKTIELVGQKTRLPYDKTTQHPTGLTTSSFVRMPLQTDELYQTTSSLQVSFKKTPPPFRKSDVN